MKYIFTLLSWVVAFLLLFTPDSEIYAQWERLSPLPQENDFNNLIKVPESGRLIAACSNSTLMYSDNDGTDWNLILNPAGMADDYLSYSLCFLDQHVGFVGGGFQSILKSCDGGITWNLKYSTPGKPNNKYIHDIAFFNDSLGFAIADSGFMIKTTDAGETWNVVGTGYYYYQHNIEVLNDSTAYISLYYNNNLLKTTDRGETWVLINEVQGLPEGPIRNMIFCNEQLGFILLGNDQSDCDIYRTQDGGASWIMCDIEKLLNIFHGKFSAADTLNIAVTGPCYSYCNISYSTIDGGDTWVTSFTPIGRGSEAVCYNEDNEIIAAGPRGDIAKSTDGMNWETIDTRLIPGLVTQTDFIDSITVYALCILPDGGAPDVRLYLTNSKGQQWNKVNLPPYSHTIFIEFIDEEHGYAQDYYGYLFYTSDAADTWAEVTTPDENREITKMVFRNAQEGFALVQSDVYKTTDGANTWSNVTPSGYHYYYTDLVYKTSDTIFLTGCINNSTYVFKSTDSGLTWELMNEVTGYGGDLYITDNGIAFLLCEDILYRSMDDCHNWSPVTISIDQPTFESIVFTTDSIGYIIGKRGDSNGNWNVFLKSTDGGLTWGEIETNSTSSFISLGFFDEQSGLLFGEQGLILSTSNGGGNVGVPYIPYSEGAKFTIYPNPAAGLITLVSEDNVNSTLRITDLTGRILQTGRIIKKETKIDISTLQSGIYLFSLEGAGTVKVIKQ